MDALVINMIVVVVVTLVISIISELAKRLIMGRFL